MQSLEQLSAKKIISLLPQACIDTLINELVYKDKSYDFASFTLTKDNECPANCWYFIFVNGEFYGASFTTVPSKTSSKWNNFKIFCIPRSGFNEVFYCDHIVTVNSVICSSLKEKSPGDRRCCTPDTMQKYRFVSNEEDNEKVLVEYFVHP